MPLLKINKHDMYTLDVELTIISFYSGNLIMNRELDHF